MRGGWARLAGFLPQGFLANVGWQYVANVWVLGTGFLFSIVAARGLGAAGFGLLSLAIGAATLIFGMLQLRTHEAIIRYLSEHEAQNDAAGMVAVVKLSLLVDLASTLAAFAVLAAASPLIAAVLFRDAAGPWMSLLAGAVVGGQALGSATAIGVLRLFGAFRTQAIVRVVTSTLQLGGTIVVLALGGGVGAVLGVQALCALLLAALLLGLGFRSLTARVPRQAWNTPITVLKSRIPEMRRFVLANYGLSISTLSVRDLDVTLLGWLGSLEAVGAYRIAKNFMTALWQQADPAFVVVYPEITRFWQRKELAQLRTFIRRLATLLTGTALILFVIAFFAVPTIAVLAAGPEFAGAGGDFRWMAWSLLVWMPLLWGHPLLCAAGRPGLSFRASMIASVVTALLYLWWIPLWGGHGAAAAYGVGIALYPILAVAFAWRAGIMFGDQTPVDPTPVPLSGAPSC